MMQLKYDSIEALESSIKSTDVGRFQKKTVVTTMKKLYDKGLEELKLGAKESAYIYFYKYMSLFQKMISCPTGVESVRKDLNDAKFIMGTLEKLKNELSKTYEIVAKNNKKLAEQEISEKFEKENTKEKFNNENDVQDFLSKSAIFENNVFWIEIDRLEECLKVTKNKLSYIIFDTRPAEEYAASHLRELTNINIPMDQFSKGTSAAMLETKLTGEFQKEWRKRNTYNFVIIMGLDDNHDKITEPVQNLYAIITKWDPNTKYEREPLILAGGYLKFAFVFPRHCTAIVQSPPKANTENKDLFQLNDIQYPQLDQSNDFEHSYLPTTNISLGEIDKPSLTAVPPNFDRSKKPTLTPLPTIKTKTDLLDDGFDEPSDMSESPPLSRSTSPEPEHSAKDNSPSTSTECLSKLESLEMRTRRSNRDKENRLSTLMKPSIPEERNKNKLNSKPSYDRSKKPKRNEYSLIDPRRYDAVVNKSVGFVIGHTGFQNTTNLCYINSIMQVLFHVDEFRDYFIQGNHLPKLNRNSKSRGAIAEEIATMLKIYWSGTYSSISCKNLKYQVGVMNQRFLNNTQEDCHEFYMFLLHYLHEDLSFRVAASDTASEAELHILKYMNNCDSFIQQLFFGQMETMVNCHKCDYASPTYTPVGCLTIEMKKPELEECLRLNYQPEEVDEFRCDKCRLKGIVTKKSHLKRTPAILTIHLKRFRSTTLRGYHKLTDSVSFPTHFALPGTCCEKTLGVMNYELIGICAHQGSMESGHYKAYVYDNRNLVWVCYDDTSVWVVGANLNTIRNITRDVYLLFYRKVKGPIPANTVRVVS